MLFDLHLSTVLSGNSLLAPEELIDQALDLGLGGIGVVEHNHYAASAVCSEFAEGTGLCVIRGLEIETDWGGVLIFGLPEKEALGLEGKKGLPMLRLLEYTGEHGAVCIPAHPFDPDRRSLGDKIATLPGIFVIEGLNGQCSRLHNQQACDFACGAGLKTIGGSEAATLAQVGSCVTAFERPITNEAEFLEELRAGRFSARYFITPPALFRD
ncbi:MAG: hypothetical protein K1Y36_16420 [Blastocatellia bacterium]|nr:hypothetical protein [Blastocatellia bacterium]